MSNLKKLAGETAIYGLSSILGRLINYALVPLYTAVLAPGEYGIVIELYAYVAFFNIIYTYGMETAYFRFASRKKEEEGKIFSTTVTSILISSLFFSLMLALLATPITNALNYPGKEHWVIWLTIILAIDAVVAVPFAKLRLDKKAWYFALARLSSIGLTVFLNVLFLVFFSNIYTEKFLPQLKPFINNIYNPTWSVEYIFLSNLIANATLIIILWKVIKKVKLRFDWEYLKPMLIYAYPLLFMGLAGVINEAFSRPMLRYLLPEGFYEGRTSTEAVGIFGACYKLSIFMSLAIQAFRYASEPFFFSKADDKNSPEVFARVMHWFIITCCFILLSVSINLDILGLILRNPAYREALHIVPILLLGNLFLGVYYNLSIWFKLTDRTYFGTWISFFGAFITITFNILLIPLLGYTGSALVTFLCYFTMTIANYLLGSRYYPIPYQIKSGFLYILFTTIVVYLVMAIDIENQLIATSFHFLIMVAFIIIVVFVEKVNLKMQLNAK